MLPNVAKNYHCGKRAPQPQDDAQATFCGKFEKADGLVDPNQDTAQTIYQKYLAFDLFPGIFIETDKGNIKLTRISLEASENSHPLPCTDDSTIYIEEAQIPGKSAMPVQDILKGHPDLF